MNRVEPLVKRDVAILEDAPHFDGERLAAFAFV